MSDLIEEAAQLDNETDQIHATVLLPLDTIRPTNGDNITYSCCGPQDKLLRRAVHCTSGVGVRPHSGCRERSTSTGGRCRRSARQRADGTVNAAAVTERNAEGRP